MSIRIREASVSWVGVLALIVSTPVGAQSTLSVTAIGQIADAVLTALVPPDSSLARVPVGQRKILFDYERTLSLFERAGTPHDTATNLHLQSRVARGTRALLEDCSQSAAQACARLGWSVYSWLEPVSITNN